MSGGDGGIRPPARDALPAFLGRPALTRLWAAARKKIEHYGAVRGNARVDEPDAAERRAVADLLGSRTVPPPGRPLSVHLGRLDRVLRESRFAVGLEEALELQGGTLRNRPAEKAGEDAEWRRFWAGAARRRLARERPELRPWLEDIARTGLYRRLAGRRSEARGELMERVLAVLGELLGTGADPGIRLAVLASRALGDSHALDVGHRVPALVLRALASIHGRPLPENAAARREMWALAGVVCDDLSCAVLVLGISPPGDDLLPRYLREHAAEGEPLRITLRQLAGAAPIGLTPTRRIYVCENPAVVSVAADRLGHRCPPLVCLSGQPDTAARVLLTSLVEGGSRLFYHGDFDWGGLRIANALSRTLPFTPWRFTSAAYLEAVSGVESVELSGSPVDAVWDGGLRPAMEEKGVAVEEEAVIEDLVGDLEVESGAAPHGPPGPG